MSSDAGSERWYSVSSTMNYNSSMSFEGRRMQSEQRFPLRGLTDTGQLESKHLIKGICPVCRPTPISIVYGLKNRVAVALVVVDVVKNSSPWRRSRCNCTPPVADSSKASKQESNITFCFKNILLQGSAQLGLPSQSFWSYSAHRRGIPSYPRPSHKGMTSSELWMDDALLWCDHCPSCY